MYGYVGVHQIQNFAIWLDLDMSDPAGSEPDPTHLDPARSGSGSKPRLLLTTEELFFCTTTGRNWNDGFPILWPNFYLSDN